MRVFPTPADDALQVRFWGVRGSHSVSGPACAQYGGHTACVEIHCGSRLFIVDAGTGLTALGAAIKDTAPPEIDILLSHLHLDHVVGLPFFKPALTPGKTIRLYCGNLGGETAEAAFDRLFSPPLFPVKLSQLPARFEHIGFRAGKALKFTDGTVVRTCALVHPSGATAYRFDHRGRSVCYVSDLEHVDPWPPRNLVEFVAGADLVIYDAMFTEQEYPRCRGWGHSTWQAGIDLCRKAGVKAMAAFHLHPHHDDAALTAVNESLGKALPGSFVARDGLALSFAPVDVTAQVQA